VRQAASAPSSADECGWAFSAAQGNEFAADEAEFPLALQIKRHPHKADVFLYAIYNKGLCAYYFTIFPACDSLEK